ncbi:hypothetical protein [Paractinoplanes atraurantiacus]|uniref:hypothetical protein n=1 Tax=Paractinoplanes atraurantiacus TaxID=1036182 RepID=UPI001178A6B2|nr:hypothetical protein [Actinoplanes atraurantiacus]
MRMAIGGATVVVLAIGVVVVTKPPDGASDRLVAPHMVMTRSPGPHGMYKQVAVPGPVSRDQRVALTGDTGVRVEVGQSHQGDHMRSEMVDMTAEPPQLEPGWEVDLTAGFPVPEDAELTRLHIALPIGGDTPYAEWNLRR